MAQGLKALLTKEFAGSKRFLSSQATCSLAAAASAAAEGTSVEVAAVAAAAATATSAAEGESVEVAVKSTLATSPRHNLLMMFTCKICDKRSVKTMSRDSYERGVVIARCGGCNNKHLIADHYGWFGKTGTVEDFLAERGISVKNASEETYEFNFEDFVPRTESPPSSV